MSRADQFRFHSRGGLDGDELVHERLVYAAAKLAQGGGQHKWSCEGLMRYSRRPAAYMTAKSVRNWRQISSSEAPNSCLSTSRANKTRIGSGGRPRVDVFGKRLAKLCSMALTRASHGKVSAHCRMGSL